MENLEKQKRINTKKCPNSTESFSYPLIIIIILWFQKYEKTKMEVFEFIIYFEGMRSHCAMEYSEYYQKPIWIKNFISIPIQAAV
jgi:hypothetical protein